MTPTDGPLPRRIWATKLLGALCRDALTFKKHLQKKKKKKKKHLQHKKGHQNAQMITFEASLSHSVRAGVKIHSFNNYLRSIY